MKTTEGLATSSTAMDSRLRCSTDRPELPAGMNSAGPQASQAKPVHTGRSHCLPPLLTDPTHRTIPRGPSKEAKQAQHSAAPRGAQWAQRTWLAHNAVLECRQVDHLQRVIHDLVHLGHADALLQAQARREEQGLADRGACAVDVLLLHIPAHSEVVWLFAGWGWGAAVCRVECSRVYIGSTALHVQAFREPNQSPHPPRPTHSTHPQTRDQVACSLGCPFTRMSPLMSPVVLRPRMQSISVVLPAPLPPISAVREPGSADRSRPCSQSTDASAKGYMLGWEQCNATVHPP